MKILAHKAGLSFLLLLIAVPVFYAFCFQIKQYNIRQRMKNRMEKEVLQTVTMDENKVKWVKPGKEAWINGRLFDIKTRSCQNGHCIFTGFFDDEETALVMELQKNHQQNKKADNDFLAQLFKLIKDVYKNSPGDQLSVPVTTRAQFLTQKSSLFSVDIPILTPPPQA